MLALLGAATTAWAFVDMIREFDPEALAGLVIQCGWGYPVLIVGAIFKAILSGAHVAFGSAAAIDGLAAVVGCMWSIFDQGDVRPHLVFSSGAFAFIAAALLPLFGYVASATYFVIADALDSLIERCRMR